MASSDSLHTARYRICERIAEIEARMPQLTPVTIARKMDAIRSLAAAQGMAALEGLADYAAQHARMPGHVIATRAAIEHLEEALVSDTPRDRETILAALAVRLH